MVATKLSTLPLQSLPKLQIAITFEKRCCSNQIENDKKRDFFQKSPNNGLVSENSFNIC